MLKKKVAIFIKYVFPWSLTGVCRSHPSSSGEGLQSGCSCSTVHPRGGRSVTDTPQLTMLGYEERSPAALQYEPVTLTIILISTLLN